MINILLIEDDEGDIFLIKKTIKKAHMKSNIIVVTAGDEALHVLKQQHHEIDFIITDINMPRMNGHEFLAEVQKDDELKKIPIAVLTNSWESEDYVKSMELDAVSCLPKPLDEKKLKKILNSMVEFWKNADNID